MTVHAITPETLERRGYMQVRDCVWARLRVADGRVRGAAVIFRPEGCYTVGADLDLPSAARTALRICNAFAEHEIAPRGDRVAATRKAKAQKLLQALMLKNLEAPSVAGGPSDFDVVVGELVNVKLGEDGYEIGASRSERRRIRLARRQRLREALNRLAKKVARNKVMVKMRNAWAKVLKGPVGKGAAKLVGTVLQAFGVPRKATETVIMAHHNRVASRLEQGGWAGVTERATREGGSVRDALREEGRRFGEGYRDAAREQFKGVIQTRDLIRRGRGAGGAAAVSGEESIGYAERQARELAIARQIVRQMGTPGTGHSMRTMYLLGAGHA